MVVRKGAGGGAGAAGGDAFQQLAQGEEEDDHHGLARRADGAWLLERRPDSGLLGGMLGWPGSDWSDAPTPAPPLDADWQLLEALPRMALTLLVGGYAQAWALGAAAKANMTETVRAWRDYAPAILPLPHPSWRNTAWLKKNPWFETEVLPYLRERVRRILTSANPAAIRSSEKDSPVVS